MNTLRDTDEGKPKPSVWPVYLAAAIVGTVSLGLLALALLVGGSSFPPPRLAALGYGLLGVIAAVGLVRLRLWGWWCAVVFMSIFAVLSVVGVIGAILDPAEDPNAAAFAVIIGGPVCLATIALVALLVRSLGTRRQLFFPHLPPEPREAPGAEEPRPTKQPEPPTHPEYTAEEMAKFKQQWRIRRIMIGIARLVTSTWVIPVFILLWMTEEKVQLPAGLLERLPAGLVERLSDPLDIVLFLGGGWLLLVLIVATFFWYFNSRCPACGRRIIGPGWRIPSACPRCGVELGRAKRHERGASP